MEKIILDRFEYLAGVSDFIVTKKYETDWKGNDTDVFSHYEVWQNGKGDFYAVVSEDGVDYMITGDDFNRKINPQDLIALMEFVEKMEG